MAAALNKHAPLPKLRHTVNPTFYTPRERWIPSETKSVASTLRFVRDIATDWTTVKGVPEIAKLLVSELFTNAITHGTADTHPSPAVRFTVVRRELMRVDTYDFSMTIPRMRQATPTETFGRGLAIVRDLSRDQS